MSLNNIENDEFIELNSSINKQKSLKIKPVKIDLVFNPIKNETYNSLINEEQNIKKIKEKEKYDKILKDKENELKEIERKKKLQKIREQTETEYNTLKTSIMKNTNVENNTPELYDWLEQQKKVFYKEKPINTLIKTIKFTPKLITTHKKLKTIKKKY